MENGETIRYYGRAVFGIFMVLFILGPILMMDDIFENPIMYNIFLSVFSIQIIIFGFSSIFFLFLKVRIHYDSYSNTFTSQSSSLFYKSNIYLRSKEIENIYISRKASYVKTIDGISSLGWGGTRLINMIKMQLGLDPIKVTRDPRKAGIFK